ncbi:chaperone NapD [Paraburkholderia sp. DHOC27]|uniref:chaperone NapD n=1 Tax=Paraburkholderia sp. DHOC27 TaxID=2303330 RepID=UPI000E3DA009|nr:chaperone NapD [Paraburkholderia sp. DHOC27]RFU49006.1 glutamate synthase [Paraburkholderia sp. DHOC27]
MPVLKEAAGLTSSRTRRGDDHEVHIAGIVVHAQKIRLADIRRAISRLPGAEIHAVTEDGKLAVTLEGRSMFDVADTLHAIHALDGVYSAALVYQHHEDIQSLAEELAHEADPPRVY